MILPSVCVLPGITYGHGVSRMQRRGRSEHVISERLLFILIFLNPFLSFFRYSKCRALYSKEITGKKAGDGA